MSAIKELERIRKQKAALAAEEERILKLEQQDKQIELENLVKTLDQEKLKAYIGTFSEYPTITVVVDDFEIDIELYHSDHDIVEAEISDLRYTLMQ